VTAICAGTGRTSCTALLPKILDDPALGDERIAAPGAERPLMDQGGYAADLQFNRTPASLTAAPAWVGETLALKPRVANSGLNQSELAQLADVIGLLETTLPEWVGELEAIGSGALLGESLNERRLISTRRSIPDGPFSTRSLTFHVLCVTILGQPLS
jgi:hypothetical protein